MRHHSLGSLLGFLACLPLFAAAAPDGNRLTYLDSDDPFYPHAGLAKFTTPQWIGEEGVEAAVIISIDDLRDPARYEAYLRPVLERLKQIDGRAPVSIFCNQLDPAHPQFQTWLAEGVSLEVHTLTHPCPLLGKEGGFEAAAKTYHGGIDLLAKIPGNVPVAFRMPCCDSMNSASPRFFAEIFSRQSPEGRHLAIDSSVMCLLTPNDKSLPRELVLDADGNERFRKYFPKELKPPSKVTFERFAGYIKDYPYPYVIGRNCWEFPAIVPSDWEALNAHGAKNPRTTGDWKAALDAIVLKQGVMTMVLHPHGWSAPQQIVELIDHAVAKHGKKVKFLNFREARERLEKNALNEQSLRAKDRDNGMRLLDVNEDGFMDVVDVKDYGWTRLWSPTARQWDDTPTHATHADRVDFGIVQGKTTMLFRGLTIYAHQFDNATGAWQRVPELFTFAPREDPHKPLVRPLPAGKGESMYRFRDLDRDGDCELLVSGAASEVVLHWSVESRRWERGKFSFPGGVSLLNEAGEANGLRFVDLNGDGFDDLLLSNEREYGIWLWAKNVRDDLGWKRGWSHKVRQASRLPAEAGEASSLANHESGKELPPFVRAGPHRNNGAWFKDGHLVVQNEDTAKLEGVVWRRSFKELIAFDTPAPKSPEASLKSMRPRPGFTVELVASEPLVVDPIAFEWDARGRLWVVEMRDYPLGVDGKGAPGGVIKVLEDTDADGRYDKATPFLEGLPFPTGVMPWRDGALIAAAPDVLYAEDTNGDGGADGKRVLFTGFKPGNQQHRMNGFEWGLDGWIYGANGDSGGEIRNVATTGDATQPSALGSKPVPISGRDFRFGPDRGEFEAESGQTQYGRRRDDWGNWFGNNNPTWLWHYTIPEHYLRRNPKLAVKSVRKVLANYDASTRVFPASEQPIRFNQPQSLGHVTSACSPAPYRDELFGPEFATSVFISEPVHNVVHREVLAPDGATFTSRRSDDERESEFLASTDVWFRPTMLKTGPDGALYIADMYRFVLEHPEWIAPETQARLDLRAGEDKGRIFRVVPSDKPRRSVPDLSKLDAAGLVAALDSPSGWQRDTAQRLLYERAEKGAAPALEKLAATAVNPKVRVQALATLDVLDATPASAVVTALRDPHAAVRAHALRVSEPLAGKSDALLQVILAVEQDPEFAVRQQLAFTLGEWKSPLASAALERLATREGTDPQMRVAILSSVAADSPLMQTLREDAAKTKALTPAPAVIASTPDRAKVIASFGGISQLRGDPARGREVFRQTCAACHRFKEEGRELGPDLGMVATKPDDWLLTAIFDPNQAVEPRYQAQHATLVDGTDLLGILTGETANNITLRAADGNERAVLRSELREIRPLGRSLMPEGLEAALTPQGAADLTSYLRAK